MFPTQSLSFIHKTVAFYLENQAIVGSYVATGEAEMERRRAAAPRRPDAVELRRRLAAKQATGT